MAIFDGKNLKGSLGNLVFKKQGDKTVVSAKPEPGTMWQTEATKNSAAVFGQIISPLAKHIRTAFSDLHCGNYDREMVNRMNSEISTVIYQNKQDEGTISFSEKSFKTLEGFDFNISSPLHKSLFVDIAVEQQDEQFIVSIPPFEVKKGIKFPKKSDLCVIALQVILINPVTFFKEIFPIEIISLDDTLATFEGQEFIFEDWDGCVAMVGVGLFFSKTTGRRTLIVNSDSFHPAEIVWARLKE